MSLSQYCNTLPVCSSARTAVLFLRKKKEPTVPEDTITAAQRNTKKSHYLRELCVGVMN